LPQAIIDLIGFQECTNKPEKKCKIGPKASANKVNEAQHTIFASAPINTSSSANPHPMYSPSCWFDSPEVEDGEVLLDFMTEEQNYQIKTKIIILIFAHQSASEIRSEKTWRRLCE
jgi:hypothetical protein